MKGKVKIILWILGIIALMVMGVLWHYYPQLKILNGYAARTACSCAFVVNRNHDKIFEEDLGMSPFNFANVTINIDSKTAESNVLGLAKKTAVYREGIGCILLKGEDDHHVQYTKHTAVAQSKYSFTQSKIDYFDKTELDSILSIAFDHGSEYKKKSRALLILHKDSLIFEKYAPGINADTKLLGWSMTKSVMNALTGIMVKNKMLSMSENNLDPSWKDERVNLTLKSLLQMNTGLEWEENYGKVSSATNMLFNSEDMPSYAASAPLGNKKWMYSSGSTNLLVGVLKRHAGTGQKLYDMLYDSLFYPCGMTESIIETDEAGNFIGSSYMYATARDWAKFGRLYLHDGVWQGKRILPEGWVKLSTEAAEGSAGKYGAHFWLNKNGEAYPNSPHDLFTADGYQGQLVVIIPSKNLVIVRLGLENINFDKMIATICKAI
jgi:CubicO group peptidase (beta-lactamase class C family)